LDFDPKEFSIQSYVFFTIIMPWFCAEFKNSRDLRVMGLLALKLIANF